MQLLQADIVVMVRVIPSFFRLVQAKVLNLCGPLSPFSGMHAQVLNRVVNEMRESLESSTDDSVDDMKPFKGMLGPLKEVLGHTPRQASAGSCAASQNRVSRMHRVR